ncbi:frataxin [Tachypleus tridentatus]|uniref:frataxin n=1 Tax=Tachypleus tridentatus TaxID=6853 RepID=UPI003FD430C0
MTPALNKFIRFCIWKLLGQHRVLSTRIHFRNYWKFNVTSAMSDTYRLEYALTLPKLYGNCEIGSIVNKCSNFSGEQYFKGLSNKMYLLTAPFHFNKWLTVVSNFHLHNNFVKLIHRNLCTQSFSYTPIKKCITQNQVLKAGKSFANHQKSMLSFKDSQNGLMLENLSAFEEVVEGTLESLCEYCEEILLDGETSVSDIDVTLSDGVLTLKLGEHGTYVINKQTPNRQIWLSSPTSGPKRYDFVNKQWIYKYDNVSLHQLLSNELSSILNTKIDFTSCLYGKGDGK